MKKLILLAISILTIGASAETTGLSTLKMEKIESEQIKADLAILSRQIQTVQAQQRLQSAVPYTNTIQTRNFEALETAYKMGTP